MEANPSKFLDMILGLPNQENIQIQIANIHITPNNCVKLQGINLDQELKFNFHISNICKNASRQINSLKHLSKNIITEVK